VNTGDQRNWQKLHEAQKFDAVQSPIFTALICAACLHTVLEDIQICAGGEMPQSATDDDGAAACPLRCLHLLHDRVKELGAEQVVRPINHCQNGNIAALFARHQRILGQSCLLFAGGSCDRII
jgi:hypothetical protein